MNIEMIHTLSQKLDNDDLCFFYQGHFNDDITEKILGLSEFNIDNRGGLSKLKRKVSFLMVESFQNIVKHGDKPSMINRFTSQSGMFLIRNINNAYCITSANLIEKNKVDVLKSKLERVNELDKDGLKALYLEILSDGRLSDKGGAGLGLIEMARKSGQRLEFDFENVNDKLSFYYLQVNLKSNGSSKEGTEMEFIPISISKEFHNKMCSENILMVYKGDFSQSSILPVLKMIENNMEHQLGEFSIKKRVYLVLVEVLQNICKHSKERNGIHEGIFMLGTSNQQYVISAGNLIENEKIESLKSQLHKINNFDKKGLNELYIRTLKEAKVTLNDGAGLGLIDVARESSDNLVFDFKPVDEKTSRFLLNVRI